MITGTGHLLALLAAAAGALLVLGYPLFRLYPDDRGDGNALVLLPYPRVPSLGRTISFMAVFTFLNVVEHSLTGSADPNTLYADAVTRIASTAVFAPSEISGFYANFNMGLRFLMGATIVSFAAVCRANALRRAMVALQVGWYLLAVIMVDSVLTVAAAAWGLPVAPATFLGNFLALAIGALAMARILFANFALPRPSSIRFAPRPRLGDALTLIGCTVAALALCMAGILWLYHVSNPQYRDLVVVLSPVPFGAAAVAVRTLLMLALARFSVSPDPPPGNWWPALEIIIPAYNEEEVIVETLEAIDLAAGHYGGPVHVILANDGSDDATEELALRTMSSFEHATGRVIAVRHGGKSATLNSALAETTAELVIRIDADTLITEWALHHVPRWFEDPSVGLVEAIMWPRWNGTVYPHMRLFEEQKQFGLLHRSMGQVDGINVVPGVFTAFRREPAVALGGFTVGMNGEDGDFTLRMSRLGWKIRQDTRVVVREGVPESFMEMRSQRIRWDRATIHNQARHGAYRAGIATPKVWYNQTHQFYSRLFAPIMLMLPIYLGVDAVFEGTYRAPLLIAVGSWIVGQICFMALQTVVAVAYRNQRQLPWVFVWPFWQYFLTMFSAESLLSLPPRPASLLRGAAPTEVAAAVVH